MENIQLEKYQIDFVKIKVTIDSSTTIRKDRLVEHPTLRNQYSLNPILGDYVKNFSLYFCNDSCVVIKSSIPYFLYGHNYKDIGCSQLSVFGNKIRELLGIDISKGVVKEFEYGGFETINMTSQSYLNSIIGVNSLQLEKSVSFMKMYGNQSKAIHYKIYDAVANAKIKKTFTLTKFRKSNIVKHEIKFLNPKKYFGEDVLFCDLSDTFIDEKRVCVRYYDLLIELRRNICFRSDTTYKPIKDDITHILYAAIKNLEQNNGTTIYNELMNLINNSELSASQKSKRKKSITLLEDAYNQEFKKF